MSDYATIGHDESDLTSALAIEWTCDVGGDMLKVCFDVFITHLLVLWMAVPRLQPLPNAALPSPLLGSPKDRLPGLPHVLDHFTGLFSLLFRMSFKTISAHFQCSYLVLLDMVTLLNWVAFCNMLSLLGKNQRCFACFSFTLTEACVIHARCI